jgi:hypothetical protein
MKARLFIALFIAPLIGMSLYAQTTQVKPVVTERNINDQVNVVRVAPRYSTAIRMPEAVSSVIVGDPAKFLAEHSDKEPALVLVKPIVEEGAESNLLVTTVKGRQVSFVVRSEGGKSRPVDFVVIYKPVGGFVVEDTSEAGAIEVAGTQRLDVTPVSLARGAALAPAKSSAVRSAEPSPERDPLDQLLERQKRARLSMMYGERPPAPVDKGDLVRTGVSEVLDQGHEVVVLFSVVNPQSKTIELLPPQIQLAGKIEKGFLVRHGQWESSVQLPVKGYRLTPRRVAPGGRADGVVVFDRPGFKQSNETLFLQIAESGAVDRPALAPIGFGVSVTREDVAHAK